jgi:amino acid transporter
MKQIIKVDCFSLLFLRRKNEKTKHRAGRIPDCFVFFRLATVAFIFFLVWGAQGFSSYRVLKIFHNRNFNE